VIKYAEDEYKRQGKFKRIFPTLNFLHYKQFFEEERPLNYLLNSRLVNKFRERTAQIASE
jgi:hypothetical protein